MKCASCDKSWNSLVSAKDSPFVRTHDEFENFDFTASILSQLSQADLEKFKETVSFRREDVFNSSQQLVAKRLGVSGFSVEILIKDYKFTPDEIESVAGIFGIGPERFWSRYHYFGDTYPEPHCVSRPYYNCPW